MFLDGFLGVEGATTRSSQSDVPSACDDTVEGSSAVEKPAAAEKSTVVDRPAVGEGPAIGAKV